MLAGSLLISGCSSRTITAPVVVKQPTPAPTPNALYTNPQLDQLPQSAARVKVGASIVRGTGRFVGTAPSEPTPSLPGAYGEPVTLDFSNVDVRDVVRSVLGDVLKVPYVIDPAAQGSITLQTGNAIPRSTVLPHLEAALRLGGLAVVETSGLYRVVPMNQATREAQLSQGGQTGFVARVLTPRYVPAAELDRLLQPFVPPGTTLRSEPSRNVLIVSGPATDVTALLDNLSVFDVDTLRGLSTAILPLRNAAAKDVAKDLTALIASMGEAGQLVRVAALDRVNAILVTSMRPDYIDRIRRWAAGLDKSNDVSERHIFVYRVQNGRAAKLATVLRKTFGITGGEGDSASEAQGQTSESALDTANGGSGGLGGTSQSAGTGANPLLGPLGGQSPTGFVASPAGGPGQNPGGTSVTAQNNGQQTSDIRITADETNNALLILATQQEYGTIEAALRQLDIAPLQVMIEATIAEVTLTDQLAYGLQYYVKSGNFQAQFAQAPSGGTSAAFTSFPFASGLNLAYSTAAGSNVVLQLLQQLTNVRVLSSPNLLVLNNQSARIQVGDQVPVATGSATSTISANAPIVNSIEYRDTGVIMKITPRVNASGIVSLDVGEEVSSVSSTTTSSLNSPTISERRLDTTVSVADGQTIALGGLISDTRSKQTNGIPVLQNIPGIGFLFGQKNNSFRRTELIAILTPHVVRNAYDARLTTQELQAKLPLTIPARALQP